MINHPDFQFSKILAGIFIMGFSENEEHYKNDKNQHIVAITKSFELMKWPVTEGFYDFIMGNKKIANRKPKINISWFESVDFCNKLSELDDKYDYRLPTEAEWEYACRAGTIEPYYDKLDNIAWYFENSNNGIHKVGLLKPNNFDLYDMLGNIWEWCSDWYCQDFLLNNIALINNKLIYINPSGPSSGSGRVIRGGSWSNDARYVRAAFRGSHDPGRRYATLGFRVARIKKI